MVMPLWADLPARLRPSTLGRRISEALPFWIVMVTLAESPRLISGGSICCEMVAAARQEPPPSASQRASHTERCRTEKEFMRFTNPYPRAAEAGVRYCY